jgi:hypothetical protein
MLDAPADRTLMAQYAQLSIQLRDYEAAAATLERLIDLEPANATARLELATAYFAMGNYPLAEFHLNAATASGALTPTSSPRRTPIAGPRQERTRQVRVSGSIAAGIVAADGDTGFLGTGALTWSIDLGDANATQWVTRIGAAPTSSTMTPAHRPVGQPEADACARARSSSLTGEAFGPRLQPYLELEAVRRIPTPRPRTTTRSSSDWPTRTPTARLDQLSPTPPSAGASWTLRRRYRFPRRVARVTYRPSREAFYRLTLSMGSEDTATRDEDQRGLRFDYGRDLRRAARFRGRLARRAPSRRSTGSTSPIPAWPGTRP